MSSPSHKCLIHDSRQTSANRIDNIKSVLVKIKRIGDRWNLVKQLCKEFKIPIQGLTYMSLHEKYLSKLEDVENKREKILEKLSRKLLKIFMFGKISSGKSSIVNGIIARKVMHPTIDKGTCCFVVLKTSVDEEHITFRNSKEPFNCQRIKELSTINDKSLKINEFVEIHLNREFCGNVLNDDIELVDIPGNGSDEVVMECIRQQCLDSNIYLLVINNYLSDEDKRFFKYQNDKSTQPDIFVLINKWDDTDDHEEDDVKESQTRLIKECSTLLLQYEVPLDVVDSRIFFISSKEILNLKINKKNESDIKDPRKLFRFQQFNNFEKTLLEHIHEVRQKRRNLERHELDCVNTLLQEIKVDLSKEFKDIRDSYNVENYRNVIEEIEKKAQKIYDKITKAGLEIKQNVRKIPINAGNKVQTATEETCGETQESLELQVKDVSEELTAVEYANAKIQALNAEIDRYVRNFIGVILIQYDMTNSSRQLKPDLYIEDLEKEDPTILQSVCKYFEGLTGIAIGGSGLGLAAMFAVILESLVLPGIGALASLTITIAASVYNKSQKEKIYDEVNAKVDAKLSELGETYKNVMGKFRAIYQTQLQILTDYRDMEIDCLNDDNLSSVVDLSEMSN